MKKRIRRRQARTKKKSYEQLRRRKRRKQLIQFIVFVLIVTIFSGVIAFFLASDYTKISQINVKNNHILTSQQVIEDSPIKNGQRYWAIDEKVASDKLKRDYPIIKEIQITKKFPNVVTINIEEYKVAGYFNFQNKNELYLEDGQKIEVTNSYLSYPIVTNFDMQDSKQKIYAVELMKQLAQIPTDVQQQISEIAYTPEEDNPKRVTAYMQDGMTVIGNISSFGVKIQYYPQMKANIPVNSEGNLDLEVGAFFNPINGKKITEVTSTENNGKPTHVTTITTLTPNGELKEVELTSQ